MEELKPIPTKFKYIKQASKLLQNYLYENFFKEILDIVNSKTVYNDKNALNNAILSGRVYYQNNMFYADRFSNAVAKELEELGAIYKSGGYFLENFKIPVEIQQSIALASIKNTAKLAAISAVLNKVEQNINEFVNGLVLDDLIESLVTDLQKDISQTLEQKKIPVIDTTLTPKQADTIAREYTNNMQYWVKNWSEKEIKIMRKEVQEMGLNGASPKTISKYFQNRWGIAQRKADFLARNETGILTSAYKAAKYQEQGYTHFRWITFMDGRERKLHAEYNNKIFRFDDPPIIEQLKVGKNYIPKPNGQRGLPKQTYNCRCDFVPVINTEFFQNRIRINNAKKSIFNKIKRILVRPQCLNKAG